MSVEFENLVINKLTSFENKIIALENTVIDKFDDVERKIEENTKKIEEISKKLDMMTNNVAIILTNTTRNHKELIKRLDQYERKNELEHSRLNYELCKLKANA